VSLIFDSDGESIVSGNDRWWPTKWSAAGQLWCASRVQLPVAAVVRMCFLFTAEDSKNPPDGPAIEVGVACR
jgi:hypothetical protein